MIFPDKLKKGDAVALVAPAFPIIPEKIPECVKCLEDQGYRVKLGETLEKELNFHNYLAGDARIRANDINKMFADPEVKAIFCARGGYGSAHIMKYLDLDMIRQNPKIFVGYSDMTNMHIALNQLCGIASFHGPMVYSNMIGRYDDHSHSSLEAALQMESELEFKNPPGEEGFRILKEGSARGPITGGNLSLIVRSIGSFFQLDTRGKILFIEEIEENIPKIDMMITQMEYAGLLDQVDGILLGDFTDCTNEPYDASYRTDAFLADRFSEYQVPIMANIRSGHDSPMGTIPLGCECRMDTDSGRILFRRP